MARGLMDIDTLEDVLENMLKTDFQLDSSVVENGIPDYIFEDFKQRCLGKTLFTKSYLTNLRRSHK